MSTDNLFSRYHSDSQEGFKAVMERLASVFGGADLLPYHVVLDISENTYKTWKRRDAVPMKYLEGFAKEHNVSLDWLRFGVRQQGSEDTAHVERVDQLTPEEKALIDNFRNCSPEGKAAIKTTSAALAKSSGIKKKAG